MIPLLLRLQLQLRETKNRQPRWAVGTRSRSRWIALEKHPELGETVPLLAPHTCTCGTEIACDCLPPISSTVRNEDTTVHVRHLKTIEYRRRASRREGKGAKGRGKGRGKLKGQVTEMGNISPQMLS